MCFLLFQTPENGFQKLFDLIKELEAKSNEDADVIKKLKEKVISGKKVRKKLKTKNGELKARLSRYVRKIVRGRP